VRKHLCFPPGRTMLDRASTDVTAWPLAFFCSVCAYTAEHYGFQLPNNPHDTALLPPPALAGVLGPDTAAALPPAQAALHRCGVPTWRLLQVRLHFLDGWSVHLFDSNESHSSAHFVAVPVGPEAGGCVHQGAA
jgi:hypothetical protein